MLSSIIDAVSSVMNPQASHGFGGTSREENRVWNGNKFPDSFGPTILFTPDYWTLRMRSQQLFDENLYARGLIRRYVTNIINTGLKPTIEPDTKILGVAEGSLDDWSDDVETRFEIWGSNPKMCDYKGLDSFWKLQRKAKQSALISGDLLVVERFIKGDPTPKVQLVDANIVQTPFNVNDNLLTKGNKIEMGVELDARGQQVAYWIMQENGDPKRLPAFDRRTGRRVAKLMYGSDNKLQSVRGTPLLGLIMQSLKELDRYRDSAQRSASIQSLLAIFMQKDQAVLGSSAFGRASLKSKEQVAPIGAEDYTQSIQATEMSPGVVFDALAPGEKPVAFEPKGAVNFKEFEEVIVHAMAWAMETPPEILRLAFGSNYAAAQAANSEFRMFINKERMDVGEEFDQPIFKEWFTSEVLTRKITARGFIRSLNDPLQYDVLGAWLNNSWAGPIKPSSDIVKTGKGYKIYIDEGLIDRGLASREVTGQKFTTTIRKLTRQNQMLADANRPLLEMQAELKSMNQGGDTSTDTAAATAQHDEVLEAIEDLKDVSN